MAAKKSKRFFLKQPVSKKTKTVVVPDGTATYAPGKSTNFKKGVSKGTNLSNMFLGSGSPIATGAGDFPSLGKNKA